MEIEAVRGQGFCAHCGKEIPRKEREWSKRLCSPCTAKWEREVLPKWIEAFRKSKTAQ